MNDLAFRVRRAGAFLLVALGGAIVTVGIGSPLTGPLRLAVVTMVLLGGMLYLLAMPLSWMPALALAFAALVPAISLQPAGAKFPGIANFILIVWFARMLLSRDRVRVRVDALYVVLLALLCVWLVVTTATSIAPEMSIIWLSNFLPAIAVPLMIRMDGETARRLASTWITVGAVLAVHACLEWVFQDDLVYGALAQLLGVPSPQHWSAYRPETSFRHPIPAGGFLAATALLALGQAIRLRRPVYVAVGLLASVATVLTQTRGAALGLLVGAVVIMLGWSYRRFPSAPKVRPWVALIMLASAYLGSNFGPLAARSESLEGEGSVEQREVVSQVVLDLAHQTGYVGTGPGTAQRALAAFKTITVPIESSALQLLLAVGAIGAITLLLLLVAAILQGMSNRNLGAAAALASLVVALSTYNAIEAKPGQMIFVGLAILLARSLGDAPRDQTSTSTSRSRSRKSAVGH
jgi:O-antigen ligase